MQKNPRWDNISEMNLPIRSTLAHDKEMMVRFDANLRNGYAVVATK